jgi:hypothetical protein
MGKSKVKKSSKGAKSASNRAATSAKKTSKSAAAKKAGARTAAKAAPSRRGGAAPVSTDIRQAYKNVLLADYMGEKKTPQRTGKKTK